MDTQSLCKFARVKIQTKHFYQKQNYSKIQCYMVFTFGNHIYSKKIICHYIDT